MSKSNKGRQHFSTNSSIFDDLERYLDFCRQYGYRYEPMDMNNMRSYPWQQYQKFLKNKPFKNMWEEDARRLDANI